MLGFNENRYLIEIYDRDPDEYADCKRFIVSVLRKDEKYYYELIHDNENHNSFLSRTPFSGKNWALIHVRDGKEGTKTEIKYASSKNWQWHNIEGIQNYAEIGRAHV